MRLVMSLLLVGAMACEADACGLWRRSCGPICGPAVCFATDCCPVPCCCEPVSCYRPRLFSRPLFHPFRCRPLCRPVCRPVCCGPVVCYDAPSCCEPAMVVEPAHIPTVAPPPAAAPAPTPAPASQPNAATQAPAAGAETQPALPPADASPAPEANPAPAREPSPLESLPGATMNEQSQAGRIVLHVARSAKVTINGRQTSLNGNRRVFVSSLQPGETYRFQVQVVDGGQVVSREVVLQAGQTKAFQLHDAQLAAL